MFHVILVKTKKFKRKEMKKITVNSIILILYEIKCIIKFKKLRKGKINTTEKKTAQNYCSN